ncbi:MAG: efflux transporter outer membrane subunit [Filimonas sp.]|nr:efflux transporter outer membrane subunit [Filimonas sp.]
MQRKIYLIAVAVSAVVLLAACKTSKEYQRPQVTVPVAYNGVSTADTLTIADISWKQFFTDTLLQGLIGKALQNNYDWQIALKNIDRADKLLQQAKAGNYPTVNFQLGAQTTYLSQNSLNGLSTKTFLGKEHLEDYSAAFQLQWEADIWGKIKQRKAKALADYMATKEAVKGLQTKLVAEIANSYYNLLMLDEQLRIAQKNVVLNDSTVNVTKLQLTAGEVTSLAVKQAEAQRDNAALLIPQLQQAITLQENALQILTGELPGALPRNALAINVAGIDNLPTGIPALLLSKRPDIRQAELALRSANASVNAAQAELYPALRISANGGTNSFKASDWFNIPSSLFGLVAGSIVQPIFQHKELKTQVEIAKISRDQAVLQFRQSVLVGVGEVSDALTQIDKLKEQQSIAAARTNTLQKAIAESQLLYKSGLANYLEVIVAQGTALQSELALADIRRQQNNAVIALYKSLGGGWK